MRDGGIKETPKTVDLSCSMADPNFRCQVSNAMVGALLPQIPGITCISGIATKMADVMLSTARRTENRILSARAEHRVGARVLVWRIRPTQYANRERSEEGPARSTLHQQPSKRREDGWQKPLEGSQGCLSSGPSSANSKHAFGKADRPASTSTVTRRTRKKNETTARHTLKTRTAYF